MVFILLRVFGGKRTPPLEKPVFKPLLTTREQGMFALLVETRQDLAQSALPFDEDAPASEKAPQAV